MGVVLFEVQFGIGVDRVRDLEQCRREPIDLCSHDLLGLDDVHGAESTGWLLWIVSDPDVDRAWFEPDTEVAGLTDRTPVEPNRHGSFEVVLDRLDSSGCDGGVGYVGAELEGERACQRSPRPIVEVSSVSKRPSPGWARGAIFQSSTNAALATTSTCPVAMIDER